ncbi:MAG: hypothetical protein APR56_00685 [Methanosaeta sp. SDB]|nr:MAG: hypothetical protein APR56_00685 [Methanosaeta sp. SDB]
MSNFLAIATVTEALKQMLDATVGRDVPGANATAVRPAESGDKGVNIYLYQVGPNSSWRNEDLPTRRDDSTIAQRPRAALDLHYLLTFYGEEVHLEPQRLLGSVVATLHAQPVLTRQRIRDAINNAENGFLNGSDLAEEIELVKFTPVPLSLEELYNLWSGFFQTSYSLSVSYQASVVFVEGAEIPKRALPVLERNLYVATFRQPLIEEVASQDGSNQPIVFDSTLVIRGKRLRGDVTRVLIGGTEVEPEKIDETKIVLALPDTIRAGVRSLQVVHKMMMGTPPEPHRGVESNVAAFVLRPAITCIDDATKVASVSPAVGQKQRVVILLNELSENSPAAYTFVLPSRGADTDEITIPVSSVEAGTYLVRVQVDGAESLLDVEDGEYAGPKVVIE